MSLIYMGFRSTTAAVRPDAPGPDPRVTGSLCGVCGGAMEGSALCVGVSVLLREVHLRVHVVRERVHDGVHRCGKRAARGNGERRQMEDVRQTERHGHRGVGCRGRAGLEARAHEAVLGVDRVRVGQ